MNTRIEGDRRKATGVAEVMRSFRSELRRSLPAWAMAVMLPAPAVITSRNGGLGVAYFFLGCMGLVAELFWRDEPVPNEDGRRDGSAWSVKMAAGVTCLLSAWAVFALMCVPLEQTEAVVSAGLALLATAPALCVVPWMLQATGNPFVAVIFSLSLVACMKLLGCIVVVLAYGWDASERGYTAMPWTQPNLLVWSFLAATGGLCALACWRTSREFGSAKTFQEVKTGL